MPRYATTLFLGDLKAYARATVQAGKTYLFGAYKLLTEMGIYRDNLSAIVIGDNFLSIIVIAQNSFDLSITVIAFVIYFVIADKLSR